MNIKPVSIGLFLILISSAFITSASYQKQINIDMETNSNEIEIRVAIYTDEPADDDFYGPYGRTCYFIYAMRNYTWKIGSNTYCFKLDLLTTKNLFKGKLSKDNYDVLLYPADAVDTKVSRSISKMQPRNILERKLVQKFIKDGGGFFGTCAGSMVSGGIINKPDNFQEKLINSISLDISVININTDLFSMPLVGELIGKKPEEIGAGSAYFWYSGWNQSDYALNYYTGVCVDFEIFHDNPIFEDYLEDTRRVRTFVDKNMQIPDNPDRDIKVLAKFPEEEVSTNESTHIHYWKYTGGLSGLIKGLFNKGEIFCFKHFGILLNSYVHASDWEKMENKPVISNVSNSPFMTTEIYPNDNHARIVRCSGHPEFNVWWGGYMKEREDTKDNNQFEGFYKWTNVTSENETPGDEFSYNYWMVRRSVAWASQKVPDRHLPAVYDESEVCDFETDNTSLQFNVTCNVKIEEEPIEVELYFRNSTDNANWSQWTLFDKDNDSSDGFSYVFNSPNGPGYYEFYSIRRVVFDTKVEMENVPPGADAKIKVI